MAHLPRWHCTACHSELARCLERGTVRLTIGRAESVYVLANGHHLIVCQCGRRNLLRGGARMLVAAPAEQSADIVR